MKEKISEFSKQKWWHIILMIAVGLMYSNLALAMAMDPLESNFAAIMLGISGIMDIVSAVLVFLELKSGYIISIIASAFMMAAGYIKVYIAKPDVYLIDFLLIVLGLVLSIISILAYRRYKIDNPKNVD